ncbi:MAG: hypothetical protein ACE15E_03235 [Acidobacteriota bacterium]
MLRVPGDLSRRCFLVSLATARALGSARAPGRPFVLADDFRSQNPAWKAVSGQWTWRGGRLEQGEVKRTMAILELARDVPQRIDVSVRLRLEDGVTFRSAGLLFGYQDPDNYWGVYVTSVSQATEPFGPKMQVFRREAGKDRYPPWGCGSCPVASRRAWTGSNASSPWWRTCRANAWRCSPSTPMPPSMTWRFGRSWRVCHRRASFGDETLVTPPQT